MAMQMESYTNCSSYNSMQVIKIIDKQQNLMSFENFWIVIKEVPLQWPEEVSRIVVHTLCIFSIVYSMQIVFSVVPNVCMGRAKNV